MAEKKPSYTTAILAEYRLLNALAKNEQVRNDPRISEDSFVDEVAKSAYEAIQSLVSRNIEVTPASLLQAAGEIDYNVTQQVIQTIWNIDEEGASSIEDILSALETAQTKDKLLERLAILKQRIENPGNLDIDDILAELYQIDTTLQTSGKSNSPLKSFNEWAEEYLEDLKQRKAGKKYSYGDMLLDDYLYKGAYPGAITLICASTNMGKSTFALHIVNTLLEKNVPCIYLSLEMSGTDTMDRLIAMRCGISNEDLYNPDPENIDAIVEAVEKERTALVNKRNFYFCEDPTISLHKLQKLIKEFKQRTHAEYCLVIVDLLTQVKDFMSASNGVNTATAMEISVNTLNALAKSENCHIVGVAQLKRDNDNVRITCLDDIEACRPTLTAIKNSGALAERSRVVLSVFRRKYFIDRYLRDDAEAMAQPDIMEVQVLKNSNGASGKILKYMFDTDHFKLLPLIDEQEAKLEQLKNLDIDY